MCSVGGIDVQIAKLSGKLEIRFVHSVVARLRLDERHILRRFHVIDGRSRHDRVEHDAIINKRSGSKRRRRPIAGHVTAERRVAVSCDDGRLSLFLFRLLMQFRHYWADEQVLSNIQANRSHPTARSNPLRLRQHSLAASAERAPCGKDRKACRAIIVAAGAAEGSRIPASRNPASAADETSATAVLDGGLSTATPNRNTPPDWRSRPHLLCL